MPRDPVTMGDRSTLPGLTIVEQRCFIDLIVCLLGWDGKSRLLKTLHLLHAKKGLSDGGTKRELRRKLAWRKRASDKAARQPKISDGSSCDHCPGAYGGSEVRPFSSRGLYLMIPMEEGIWALSPTRRALRQAPRREAEALADGRAAEVGIAPPQHRVRLCLEVCHLDGRKGQQVWKGSAEAGAHYPFRTNMPRSRACHRSLS
ncbi:hypothetical protein THAOC_14657 [Thalassiosira oceanica]|uniref:Uncharacterized protein n=1 Tax=Thalassiosira oceanica TaxID=159749 RepID=K0T2D5_THAOC|nr:hypothetical protein THAOC_14657 [Thalassiosira oceanica]|eukprot:EJK64597.1 hypothetical protein THAOC_14657 [Thalassiosira oceanica]